MDRADVVIITALRMEFEAAENAGLASPGRPGVRAWRDVAGDFPHLAGEYRTADGEISVVLARPTRMGGRPTAPITTALAGSLRPICLAMCGVCAGNPDDLVRGDVVVPSLVYEYDEGRLVGGDFEGDHQQYPQDSRWLRVVQEFSPVDLPSYGTAPEDAELWLLERLHHGQNPRTHPARERYFPPGTWRPRLEQLESAGKIRRAAGGWALTDAGSALIQRALNDSVDGPQRLPFEVTAGPMASGSSVVQDRTVWTRLRRMGVRGIAALDMEAATIATVADEQQVPHWLVAKGVMDHADLAKEDRYKRFAARASAEVLYALLERLIPPFKAASASAAASSARSGAVTTGASPHRVPDPVRQEVIQRLAYDWRDLADHLGVPRFVTSRFPFLDEPRQLWNWLDARRRLPALPDALDEIGRTDLAELLRRWLT